VELPENRLIAPFGLSAFQFGNAPFINVLPLVSPFQLLAAEVFSDLARQTIAKGDQGLMYQDQAVDGQPSVLNGQAVEELFAQLAPE
jgi:hypothetical protein